MTAQAETDATRGIPAELLGVFRVVFSALVLLAMLDLVPHVVEYFSDEGLMPRAAYLADQARTHRFALADAFGRPWQAAVYLAACFAAVASMGVGFHTRASTVASFLLVVGLQERNKLVFDGSDNVIRCMLFWAMFVDWGRATSVDALRRGTPAGRLPVLPAKLLEWQLGWVYVGSVVLKLQGPRWLDGTALRNGLMSPHAFSRAFAYPLGELPLLVRGGTYGALALELLVGLAFFVPRRFPRVRKLGLIAGASFHLTSFVLMNVGWFPWLMTGCYVLALEPADVERLRAWMMRTLIEPAAARLPDRVFALTLPELSSTARTVRDTALIGLFGFAMWFSLPSDTVPFMPGLPAPVHATVQSLSLWQQWDMFSPEPILQDYYVTARGRRGDGEAVDPFTDGPSGRIADHVQGGLYKRWTKVMNNVAFGDDATKLQVGRYICRAWNGRASKTLESLESYELVRHTRRITALGEPPAEWVETVIWQHRCFD